MKMEGLLRHWVPAFVLAAMFGGCSDTDAPVSARRSEGGLRVVPVVRMSKQVASYDIDHGEAKVAGDRIKESSTFRLEYDQANEQLVGTLLLPQGGSNWSMTVYIYDGAGRKIGQGGTEITSVNVSSGKLFLDPISVSSAKPVVSLSVDTPFVGINDSVLLSAAASDSFGGTIAEIGWRMGAGQWELQQPETSSFSGTKTFVASGEAGVEVFELYAEDNEGNRVSTTESVTVEIRPPSADAGNDTTVGVKDSIILVGNGTDESSITEYAWKCGDGSWIVSPSGAAGTKAPSDEQSFVCSLRVKDDDGNLAYDEVVVNVQGRAPTADAGNDTTVGINDSIHLHGTGTDETMIAEHAWKCGEGSWSVTESGQSVTVAPSTEQVYVCSLRVSDDDGMHAYDAVSVTVEVRAPTADAGTDTAVGVNDRINVYGSGNDETEIAEYAWKFGSGEWTTTSSGETHSTAPSSPQVFVCSLRVRDDDGNTAYDACSVTVELRAPTAQAGLDTVVGQSALINLNGTGSDETEIVEYAWKTGNGSYTTADGGQMQVTAPSTAQLYLCSLRVQDDDGAYAYDVKRVYVYGSHSMGMAPIPGAGQNFSAGGNPPMNCTFWIDRTEVTQKDYFAKMGQNPSYFGGSDTDQPVEDHNGYDAMLYCNARSKADGLDTVYKYTNITGTPGTKCRLGGLSVDTSVVGYRLPTESEWEFACRGGTQTEYYWGGGAATEYAWFVRNSGNTPHVVATREPNDYGLYDMAGNVAEWTNNYLSPTSSASIRGGHFLADSTFLKSSDRQASLQVYASYYGAGFRCVLVPRR